MDSLYIILEWRSMVRVATALLIAAITAPVHGLPQSANRQIGLGEARSFHSAILNEDREVQIALPETYGRTAISYPVLFLLDGSSHLLHASATARFLASARNRQRLASFKRRARRLRPVASGSGDAPVPSGRGYRQILSYSTETRSGTQAHSAVRSL